MNPIEPLSATFHTSAAGLFPAGEPFSTELAVSAAATTRPAGTDDNIDVQSGDMRIGSPVSPAATIDHLDEAGMGEPDASGAGVFHEKSAVLNPLVMAATAKRSAPAAPEPALSTRQDNIGVDDTALYLAMVAGTAVPLLRQSGVARTPLFAIVKARLKARSGRDDDVAASVDRSAALSGYEENAPEDDAV
jgi:hypothetical protein